MFLTNHRRRGKVNRGTKTSGSKSGTTSTSLDLLKVEAIAAALKAANADVLIEPSYQIETEGILQKPLIVDPVPCAIIAAKGY